MSSRFKLLIISLLSVCITYANELSEYSRISLLTCEPGTELYERYGHTAIRVMDPLLRLDNVYNYGVFTFNTDHFYYKFVTGQTMYLLDYEPYRFFAYEYRHEHRKVCEQVLNLDLQQRNRVWNALQTNLLPENCEYLYNFVFDNCATRPYHLIMDAIGDSIQTNYVGYEGQTYRTFLSHYTGKNSWTDFGINLLFGPKADQPMYGEQRLFLPEELMLYLASAKLSNGTPLVYAQDIRPFTVSSTKWYLDWRLGGAILFILLLLLSIWDVRRGKCTIGVDYALLAMYAIILMLVTFLTFFSLHPLVGFGWRLLIIPAIHLCARLVYILKRHWHSC